MDPVTNETKIMTVTVAWCIEQILNSEDVIEGWALENPEENDEFAHIFGTDDDEEYEWVDAENMQYDPVLGANGEVMPDFTWTQDQVDLHDQGWRWHQTWRMWWHPGQGRWSADPANER